MLYIIVVNDANKELPIINMLLCSNKKSLSKTLKDYI